MRLFSCDGFVIRAPLSACCVLDDFYFFFGEVVEFVGQVVYLCVGVGDLSFQGVLFGWGFCGLEGFVEVEHGLDEGDHFVVAGFVGTVCRFCYSNRKAPELVYADLGECFVLTVILLAKVIDHKRRIKDAEQKK